jgi:hypothetical protein
MKFLALVLPFLLLAGPATKPASVESFTIELRAVELEFDWPLPADAPPPREFDERLVRLISEAALGAGAKELWTLSTSAHRGVPFACTAVIGGKTHFLKGTLRGSNCEELMAAIEAGATWQESKGANTPPMINTSMVKTTAVLKADQPRVIMSSAPGGGNRKATAYTTCVKRVGDPT